MQLNSITSPTLLLDERKCRDNIRQMTSKITKSGIVFRPHFKTHQSGIIGEWFREEGISSISVSSVKMAKYFAATGWDDISIAFPVNLRELPAINKLAKKNNISILIAGTGIKIDTGYGRSGILSGSTSEIEQVLTEITASKHLEFEGFLSHTGNTYHAASKRDIKNLFNDARKKLIELQYRYIPYHQGIKLSLGDTPSASISDNFPGLDELRPGNFVFYDLMQHRLGSCKLEQVATVLACPVVAKYSKRRDLVIQGGAIHLSKEYLPGKNNEKNFGQAVLLTDSGWKLLPASNRVVSVSQEHGIVRLDAGIIDSINPGDLIGVIPVHSCLTANLMKSYLCFDGTVIPHLESGEITK